METNTCKQKSVKVIDHWPHTKRKGELYIVLGKFGIFQSKMHSGQGIFFPIIYVTDLEELLKDEVKNYASDKGFEIKTPIEYSAMKTVIIQQIDEYPLEDIKENIETVNQWAKVTDVYKFGTTSEMLKVQFDNTSMANKTVSEGMIILYRRVPPKHIEKEIFIKLKPCNNCFQYDHKMMKCKEEKLTVLSVETVGINRVLVKVPHQSV